MPSAADTILDGVFAELGLDRGDPAAVYRRVDDVVATLRRINDQETIAVPTTGTITERLCEFGLRASVPGIFHRLSREWKWIGDFYVLGAPFNTVISVKSFKAKERLLSSGTGNLLSPSIGFGLFDDPNEWSLSRLQSYLFRAFFIIYMPTATLNELPDGARRLSNINNRPFLRSINSFTDDLHDAVRDGLLDPRSL